MSVELEQVHLEANDVFVENLARQDKITRIVANLRHTAVADGREWHDNSYDRFMYQLVGDPHAWTTPGKFPIIERQTVEGLITYNKPQKYAYSEKGNLVYIRETSQKTDERLQYFVASANLRTGAYTEWTVRDTRLTTGPQLYPPSLEQTIFLQDRPLLIVPPFTDRVASGDPIEDQLRIEEEEQAKLEYENNRPRCITTTQGGWFVPEQNGEREALADGEGIHKRLGVFYRSLGAAALDYGYIAQTPQAPTV